MSWKCLPLGQAVRHVSALTTTSSRELRKALLRAEASHGVSEGFLVETFNVNDVLKCAGLLLNMRGSDHPIINNCRDLLFGGMTSYKNTGTLVSLFSKLKRKGTASVDDALVRANYERVVKASEMLHIMQALHSSTLTTCDGEKEEDVVLGNKLAVLVGDLFLTLSFKEITDIQDSTVLEAFSKGVELFATPDFEEAPRRPSLDWWEKSSAEKRSWFATAFECSVLVAGLRCDDEREAARKCGRNLVLTMQANKELEHFVRCRGAISTAGSTRIPSILLSLSDNFQQNDTQESSGCQTKNVPEEVTVKINSLMRRYTKEILSYLDGCETSDASEMLREIVLCLGKPFKDN